MKCINSCLHCRSIAVHHWRRIGLEESAYHRVQRHWPEIRARRRAVCCAVPRLSALSMFSSSLSEYFTIFCTWAWLPGCSCRLLLCPYCYESYISEKKARAAEYEGLNELANICALCNDSAIEYNEVQVL